MLDDTKIRAEEHVRDDKTGSIPKQTETRSREASVSKAIEIMQALISIAPKAE